MASSRQHRAVRGIAAASVATFVALLSHVLGGGDMPGVLGIAVPWALSLPACVLLTGKRLSLWRLSISVAVSQVLFHTLFVLDTPTTGAPMTTHGAHGAQMAMPVADPSAHTAAMHADPTMWLWHGIAAAVTIAIVYWGEQALMRLRQLAAQTIAWARQVLTPMPAPIPAPAPVERLVSLYWSPASLSGDAALAPLRRRGPPLLNTL